MSQQRAAELPGRDRPATYRIRVRGVLDSSWADELGNLSISTETLLVGSFPDQAAIHGLIETLNMLGLPIIKVELLETD